MTGLDGPVTLRRFTYLERIVHWVVGVTFVLLLVTGLAFSYPALFWMTGLLGGGPAARMLHPWIGLAFTAGLAAMFVIWVKDMFLGGEDARWLRAVRHYAMHDKERVPPAGKYNAGQKLFFWLQSALGIAFLVTGLFLWLPGGFAGMGPFGRGTLTTMRTLHYLATLGGGLLLIVHVYLGTVAYPGTFGAMIHGRVSRAWARFHHPRWEGEEKRS